MDFTMMKNFDLEEKVSSESMLKYQDKVPKELIEIWKNYGFGSFMDGYLRIINPDDYIELLNNSYFRANVSIPIMVTAFGDIVTWEEQRYVGIIDYRHGINNTMAAGFEIFLMILKEHTFQKRFFDLELYKDAFEQYGKLNYNECFGFVPLIAIGGTESVKNIKKVKIREYIAIICDLMGGV